MLIQKILLPVNDICSEMGMYFNGHDFKVLDNGIKILKNGEINTDTYFNSISIQKWFTYTKLKTLKLSLEICGKCEIYLCHAWIDEKNIIRRKGDNVVFYKKNDDGKQSITLDFPQCFHGVIAYFRVKAIGEDIFLYKAQYETAISEEICQSINIAIGVCTYKREEYIKKNIDNIKEKIINNEQSVLYNHLDVYVSDNGQTLDLEEFKYKDIYVFSNKNVGGSGGFTRCIIEALKRKEKYSHIILMDDDVVLDCNILERNFIFLKLLKDEYEDALIGGGMLVLDSKFRQFENAAYYYRGQLSFTQKNVDLRTIRNVITNEQEKEVNYNAWCYCCMPLKKVTTDNLPLPLFIHMDDVEYSVRNKFIVITLNGICVWHPFSSNQRGSSIAYYDMRNKLIVMSEFGGMDIRKYAMDYLEMFHKFIFNYDYERTMAACKGIEDFCRGIDYFKKMDPISLNMELASKNARWKEADKNIVKAITDRRPVAKISRKSLLINYLLPSKDEKIVLDCDISGAFPDRTKKLYIYSTSMGMYCVFQKSILKMLKAKWACRKARKLIKTKMLDVSFEWKDRMNEITNLKYWSKYLDIPEEF